jgi:hypothetical protein
MKLADLKAKLDAAGVLPEAYSLTGGLPSERYVLNQLAGGRWEVYYSERGLKSGLHSFEAEDAACKHLLDQILRDPLARPIKR